MDTTTSTDGARAMDRPTPQWRPRLRTSGDGSSLRETRRMVCEALAGIPEDIQDRVVLASGELITNAVVHGGGTYTLELETSEECLKVRVTDSGPGEPRVVEANSEREHGRGMAIVDAMSTCWGTELHRGHKVVWFELALRPVA